MMESKSAVASLAALAHEGRLAAFRLLVRSGDEGLPSGDLAELLGVPANSLSTNLGILARAGLVASRRQGRLVIYQANYSGMSSLISFLMEDCCRGRPEVCAPVSALAETLQNA
jgi:ArsR family transcriptional regulator, arsenate/arsenite/antimonite-responsive transcriptional repressor